MSLLLDALKSAAKEKQKQSKTKSEHSTPEAANEDLTLGKIVMESNAEQSDQENSLRKEIIGSLPENQTEDELQSFTLEPEIESFNNTDDSEIIDFANNEHASPTHEIPILDEDFLSNSHETSNIEEASLDQGNAEHENVDEQSTPEPAQNHIEDFDAVQQPAQNYPTDVTINQPIDPFSITGDDDLYSNETHDTLSQSFPNEENPPQKNETQNENKAIPAIKNNDLLAEFGISPEEAKSVLEKQHEENGDSEDEREAQSANSEESRPRPQSSSSVTANDPLELLVKSGRKDAKKNRYLAQICFISAIILVIASGLFFYYQMNNSITPPVSSTNVDTSSATASTFDHEEDAEASADHSQSTPNQEIKASLNSQNSQSSSDAANRTADKSTDIAKPIEPNPVPAKKKTQAPRKPIKQKPTNKETSPKTNSRINTSDTRIKTLSISELNKQAYNLFHQKSYSEADHLYNKVLQHKPRNRDALLGKAAIALANNNRENAATIYKQLLQINPKDSTAHAALSSLNRDWHSSLSQAQLQFMLRENSSSPHLYFALGNSYALQQNWRGAQESYFAAFSLEPTNADYCYNLAISLDKLEKFRFALKYYNQSLQLSQSFNSQFSTHLVAERISQLNKFLATGKGNLQNEQ